TLQIVTKQNVGRKMPSGLLAETGGNIQTNPNEALLTAPPVRGVPSLEAHMKLEPAAKPALFYDLYSATGEELPELLGQLVRKMKLESSLTSIGALAAEATV